MAAKAGKRGTTSTVTAVLVGLGLLVAGCQSGPPEPSPTETAPFIVPGPPQPWPPPRPGISGESVHFTAQGDIGVEKGAKQVLDTIAALGPQLNLALGDFTYKAGIEEEFCDMVKGKLGQDFPYQLLTGNHESDGHDGDIAKFVKCLPNRLPGLRGDYGTQWYVDVPETNPLVRFVMVSPGIDFKNNEHLDYSMNSERGGWTMNAIDGAAAANIPWTVVGMHAPCLSVGEYDCKVGQDFANMLLEKKVDLVLTGHDHVYQRTHQLGTSNSCRELVPNAFAAACITDSDAEMVKGAGTVFATVGLGGADLYNVDNDDSEAGYFAIWSGKNRNPAFGTLDVTATADQLSARFVPAEGYSFTDAFSIDRR